MPPRRSGAAIGLSALTRTEGLAFLLLLVLPPPGWRRAASGGGPRWQVAVVAAVVVIAPPGRCATPSCSTASFPISTNEGTVLAGRELQQDLRRQGPRGWRFTCVSPFRNRNEGEQAKMWRARGSLRPDHAGRLPKVVAARVLRTWDLFPPGHVVTNEGRMRWIATARDDHVLPAAAAGVRRGLPPAPPASELVVLLSPLVIVTLVSAYGWGLTRFRHSADVAIVVLAAVALVELARRLAARRRLPSLSR